MKFTDFVRLIYGLFPVQQMRKEATDVYIQLMREQQNMDVTYTTEDMPGDITIEDDGSWTVVPYHADTLNAFQHAYTTAKLTKQL